MSTSKSTAAAPQVDEEQKGFETLVRNAMVSLRITREAGVASMLKSAALATPPSLMTLRERLERPRPALTWRINGWLPRGARVILSAQFKAGKTTLVGNLIRSVVDSDEWLGVAAVTRIDGAVALFDFEMSEFQLDDWLRDQTIRHDGCVIVAAMRGRASTFNILDKAVRTKWATWLRENRVAFVVLDCLRPILDALGLDEQHDAGRFLVALDALLAEAGVGEAVVIHHMGHGGERARGDSRLRDWPDVEWQLVRETEDPTSNRYVSAYGRDVDVKESRLSFDKATRRVTLMGGGSRKDAKIQAAYDAVCALLAETPNLSGRQIQEGLLARSNHSRADIRAAIKRGVVRQTILVEKGDKNALLHRLGPVETP